MQELDQALGNTPYRYTFRDNEQAVPSKQGSAEAHNARGISHAESGKYDLAITDFNTAIKRIVDEIELYRSIILNPLSHAAIANIYRTELEGAIAAIEHNLKRH